MIVFDVIFHVISFIDCFTPFLLQEVKGFHKPGKSTWSEIDET
uniref:Uncharacterized protein n=1 Tax=Octopus bimaculoides TaxID=37653 RepID=A0A0L8G5I6_OCTBM